MRNNYSHIAYVLECMEDELGEKTNEDYDNEDNVSNENNHNMGMDYQNKLQYADCFPELAALASNEIVNNNNSEIL